MTLFNTALTYKLIGLNSQKRRELHGQVVQFVFFTPGTYETTLNCTDAGGNYNSTTVELVVGPLIPEFGSLAVVIVGLVAIFLLVRRSKRKPDQALLQPGRLDTCLTPYLARLLTPMVNAQTLFTRVEEDRSAAIPARALRMSARVSQQ